MMKRFVIFLLLCLLVMSVNVSALAASQSFSFNLSNSGTTMYIYSGASNTKVYENQAATIRVSQVDAPGYGYRLCLANSSYAQATVMQWFNYNGKKAYLTYLEDQAVVGENYYVAGRIDNDYDGPYTCSGKFNSDKASDV